jgi:protocatechuate 3,4-dioxygenase beta subunit
LKTKRLSVLRGTATVFAALVTLTAACADDGPPTATASPASPSNVATPVLGTGNATPAGAATPQTPAISATPGVASTCRPGVPLTAAQTEGPYYSANPPQRATLIEPGMAGARLLLSGIVVTQDCRPVANARLDFWQADAAGAYDNTGFRLRGYQLADSAGRYRLETIVPAEYPGRTVHIHVKVTPPGGATLTSQLYFPEVARNSSDGIFSRELLVQDVVRGPEGVTARFDFVVR